VDDLVIESRAEGLAGLVGAQSADAMGIGGALISETACELLSAGVANTDDVAFVELTFGRFRYNTVCVFT
jgi:hypothetical protein